MQKADDQQHAAIYAISIHPSMLKNIMIGEGR
jgi:hypothetical protein